MEGKWRRDDLVLQNNLNVGYPRSLLLILFPFLHSKEKKKPQCFLSLRVRPVLFSLSSVNTLQSPGSESIPFQWNGKMRSLPIGSLIQLSGLTRSLFRSNDRFTHHTISVLHLRGEELFCFVLLNKKSVLLQIKLHNHREH